MLISKPFSGTSEANHNLVADHQDAVFITQVTNTLQVSLRHLDDAAAALHGLSNQAGNLVRILLNHLALQHLQQELGILFLCLELQSVITPPRSQEMNKARNARVHIAARSLSVQG